MKKLLVLILAIGLVMGIGTVFAGPVHNNGPGLLSETYIDTIFVVPDATTANVDIAGRWLPSNYSGVFYNSIFSESELALPNMIFSDSATLSPHTTISGAIFAQEVIPVSGYSKAAEPKMIDM